MIRYVIRRLLGAVLVVFIVSVITFLIFQLAPAIANVSPAYYYVGKIPPTPQGLHEVEHRFGFDLPWWEQYYNFVHGIVAGRTVDDGTNNPIHCHAPCLGYSYRLNLPVTHMIAQAAPVTLSLAIGAAILWLVGGLTVGVVSALKPGSFLDRFGMSLSLAAVSLPIFFTGPLLLLIFSYQTGLLPNVHYVSFLQNPLSWARNLVLAWVALAFLFAALYARLTRANMLETMGEDYIRTARAKGLPYRTVVIRHGLRAALTPIVTIFGIDFASLIGSTVITETVFNLRGLGKISIDAINSQDLPVIMGVTIIAALAIVVANIIVDIAYGFVDPRVSYA